MSAYEQTIERLVELLDEITPDLDEPSLGWKNEGSQERLHSSPGDREWECEDEGAEHDGRESQGQSWPNPMGENRIGETRP